MNPNKEFSKAIIDLLNDNIDVFDIGTDSPYSEIMVNNVNISLSDLLNDYFEHRINAEENGE